jgi:hypothetical protein
MNSVILKPKSSNPLPRLINLAAIVLFAAIALALQFPKLNQKVSGQSAVSDRLLVKQEETRLNATSNLPKRGFGYNNLIANWTFLSFLQYFGDDVARVRHQTGYSLSPKYFQIIINRDPRFLSSYIYLSTSVSIFAAQPQLTVDLINNGVKYLSPELNPLSYTAWRRKGTDEMLFLGQPLAASKSFSTAAEWADRAKFVGNELPETKLVAESSRQTAAFLRSNPNSRAARINGWAFILSSAIDRKTTEIAVIELDRLGITVNFRQDGSFGLIKKGLKK